MAIYARGRKWSWTISIGGGFITACVLAAIVGVPVSLVFKNEPVSATPAQVVQNSAYDGSVRQVEEWMEKNLDDPGSFKAVEWSPVVTTAQGNYVVRCKFRAKNKMGALVLENKAFILGSTGIVLAVSDYQN